MLLDAYKNTVIGDSDHSGVGYRAFNPHPSRKTWSISYPCFNTPGGRRIELAKGIWTGAGYSNDNLRLINVPVLKTHGGCGVTGALKLFYGVLSMHFSHAVYHNGGYGQVFGEMFAHVRMPDLNIMDAIWVSHKALNGTPGNTSRQDTLLASIDPVALDFWAGKYVIYPIDSNPNHHPDLTGQYTDSCFSQYLDDAAEEINACLPAGSRRVTRSEPSIACHEG